MHLAVPIPQEPLTVLGRIRGVATFFVFTKEIPKNTKENMQLLSSHFFLWEEALYFCESGSHAKFCNPGTTLSSRKVTCSEEREREIMLLILATTRTNY